MKTIIAIKAGIPIPNPTPNPTLSKAPPVQISEDELEFYEAFELSVFVVVPPEEPGLVPF